MLILRCDSEKLYADGLGLDGATKLIQWLSQDFVVEVRDITTQATLSETFRAFAENKQTFDIVTIIAHGNREQLRLAKDYAAPWAGLAEWLRPLRPRRLVLIACAAGNWPAGNELFGKLRYLRRIYAPPVNANLIQGAAMLFALPYLLANRTPKPQHVLAAQALTTLASGGQLREWLRDDARDSTGRLLDIASMLFDPSIREAAAKVRDVLGNMLRGRL
jgi:hypothetical protein